MQFKSFFHCFKVNIFDQLVHVPVNAWKKIWVFIILIYVSSNIKVTVVSWRDLEFNEM